jgi:hypothetical protein
VSSNSHLISKIQCRKYSIKIEGELRRQYPNSIPHFNTILNHRFIDPKPDISIVREASFGHGQLEVVNATHALWTWNRNDDDVAALSDSIWLRSLSSDPACKVQT